MKKMKVFAFLMAVVMLLGCLSGCSSTPASSAKSSSKTTKYKIALSNSYMGNDWRQIMTRTVQYVSQQQPYASEVDFRVVNTDNTAEAQSASIDDLTAEGYNAILVDAASPTALNPAIERAIAKGVVVISFDQVVTAKDVYIIQSNYQLKAKESMLYICKMLNGKGNILVDRGLPGSTMSAGEFSEVQQVLKDYPGINVVGEFDGKYDPATTQQAVASALTSSTNIDAVWTQGPMTAVVNAFKAAGRTVPIITGGGYGVYNGDAETMLNGNYKGLVWLFDMPGMSAIAYEEAINILKGKTVNKNTSLNDTFYASNDTSIDIGATINKLQEGVNCWKTKDSAYGWPVLPANFDIKVTPDEVYPKS